MRLNCFLILGSTFSCIFAFSVEKEWLKCKRIHGKSYDSKDEEAFRLQIFQDNLQRIQENNQKFANREVSYSLGINKFTDYTDNELGNSLQLSNNFYETKLRDDNEDTDCSSDDIVLPDTYDYREEGAVTPVKDGRRYGEYAWAFAVSGALEAQVYFSVKSVIPLSAQQLIDCVDVGNANKTFWGGKLDFVYDYITNHGIFTEDEYPYTESRGECQDDREKGITPTLLINTFSECGIKQSLVLAGPVTAVIDASRLFSYQSGIVDNTMCSNAAEDANHAVLIVGFGKEEDLGEYWIIKNSWGSDWGEDGYFRLARLRNNTCGIGTSPSYPIIFHDSDNSSIVQTLHNSRKVYFDSI